VPAAAGAAQEEEKEAASKEVMMELAIRYVTECTHKEQQKARVVFVHRKRLRDRYK
jgi:hypothetical protein